ncbi:hypothetical protein Tco_1409998 [Tanacetum coccineum]
MHNNIMAAGSRDRPPMLATGRYAQWRSRFLRYIDTRPNGDALRKCILKGPYTPTIVTTPAIPGTDDSPAVPEQITVKTVTNMTPENRAHLESEKEAIHLILNGIGNGIYSTVDACQTVQEMWEAIERLQQGLVPQRQNASDYDNPDPTPELQNVSHSADITVPSQQELDVLFGPLYDEFFNDGTSRVNKSSFPTNNSAPQDTFQRIFTLHQNRQLKQMFMLRKTTIINQNLPMLSVHRYKNRTIRLDSLGNQRQRMLVWALGNCSVPLVQQERNLTDRDTMKRIDEQELEAHYSYMAKIQEGSNATQELIHESIRTIGKRMILIDADQPDALIPKSTSGGIQFLDSAKHSGVILFIIHNDAWKSLPSSSQAVNKSPTHYPCDSARTFRVILFSIHNDEWKSFQCHHQTALRSYALSWKPCQGDSLNLPDHRIHKDGDGDASFQLKSDSLPHAHAQTTKTFYKHQDSRIMKAQELKTKTSAQTLIYKIFLQRYQVYQGRLLASFQDDAKYEHVGQDTRSQGGKDDQDGRIKI